MLLYISNTSPGQANQMIAGAIDESYQERIQVLLKAVKKRQVHYVATIGRYEINVIFFIALSAGARSFSPFHRLVHVLYSIIGWLLTFNLLDRTMYIRYERMIFYMYIIADVMVMNDCWWVTTKQLVV